LGVIEAKGDPDNENDALKAAKTIDPSKADDPRIRSAEIGRVASLVSVFPAVRAALLQYQRDFAARPPGAVIDGRDIGTIVCPHAQAKLFIDAAPEIRAHRRWLELGGSEAAILKELLERDARDRSRAVAPLKPAPDAALLDTTALDIDAAFKAALALVERSLKVQPQG
jgi:CMP/dCMP kinase